MIEFILNNQDINSEQPSGSTVLDFVRYHQNLKGTKIGCREGDCGACTILVGELVDDTVKYRTMTSCLMPLANADGKHIVTIEGINPADGGLTPVQQALIDESGTQCGFCTVGFVMSLTGFCLDQVGGEHSLGKGFPEMAISAIDGNICRCTGYKSIERAACRVSKLVSDEPRSLGDAKAAMNTSIVPGYFDGISERLKSIAERAIPFSSANRSFTSGMPLAAVGGGTDLYVQRPDEMAERDSAALFYDDELRGIRDSGEYVEIGASATVTDLLESQQIQSIFPDLYKHLKLVSSTPIRNMATLAGNFANASPIGDMTVWFLALDAEIDLRAGSGVGRTMRLKDLYVGYKQLAKGDDEYITKIRFRKPGGDFRFNFEKVCKRTYLDIATVNTALSLDFTADDTIAAAHLSAGGVAPIPLYLKETSAFLNGRQINGETIAKANEIIQTEISPISDVRGTEKYKRLLLRQLFTAHFVEIFDF